MECESLESRMIFWGRPASQPQKKKNEYIKFANIEYKQLSRLLFYDVCGVRLGISIFWDSETTERQK